MQSFSQISDNVRERTFILPVPQPSGLLTLAQAARRIGCTKRALQYGCERHQLPYVWDENKYKILVNFADAQNWWLRTKNPGGRPKKR